MTQSTGSDDNDKLGSASIERQNQCDERELGIETVNFPHSVWSYVLCPQTKAGARRLMSLWILLVFVLHRDYGDHGYFKSLVAYTADSSAPRATLFGVRCTWLSVQNTS
ncbi:hypothetical protein PC122_g9086 [Phytophthora cactorum]|nr:hypothetical protein PC122_g9086 [Phytophthora cactorum]